MRISRMLVLFAALTFTLSAAPAQTVPQTVTAIRFGKLIDGTGKVVTHAVVIVKGDRIESVGSRELPPKGAQVIDLQVAPGSRFRAIVITIPG